MTAKYLTLQIENILSDNARDNPTVVCHLVVVVGLMHR